jgi:HSP20 family protein
MSQIKIDKVPAGQDRDLPVFEEMERIMDRIRERAFSMFADRGLIQGRELDDWLRAEREICWPAAELAEKDNGYVLNVALPGFDPADVSVTATPRELIVKAIKTTAEKEMKAAAGRLAWSELDRDEAYRRIELPTDINVDKITATLRNGLLEIVAPKAKSVKAVEVKSEKVDIAA